MIHGQVGAHDVVRVLGQEPQEIGWQQGAASRGAAQQRMGGGRGPAQNVLIGDAGRHPVHVTPCVRGNREVDRGATGFGQLGPEGDGQPHSVVGVDREQVHEVGGQGRIPGEFGQVDALGQQPFGVRVAKEPPAQRHGQGGRVAEQRRREPRVVGTRAECGRPPYLGVGVAEQRGVRVRRQVVPEAQGGTSCGRIGMPGQGDEEGRSQVRRGQQCAPYGRFGVCQEARAHGVRQRADLLPGIVGPLGSVSDGGSHLGGRVDREPGALPGLRLAAPRELDPRVQYRVGEDGRHGLLGQSRPVEGLEGRAFATAVEGDQP